MTHQLVFACRTVITGKQATSSRLPAEAVRVAHTVCPYRVAGPGVVSRNRAFRCQTQYCAVGIIKIVRALPFKRIAGGYIEHAIGAKLQRTAAMTASTLLGRQPVEQNGFLTRTSVHLGKAADAVTRAVVANIGVHHIDPGY